MNVSINIKMTSSSECETGIGEDISPIEEVLFFHCLRQTLPQTKEKNIFNISFFRERHLKASVAPLTAEDIMSSEHTIDYNSPKVKQFLKELQACFSDPRKGLKPKEYENLWKQIGDKDLATVYLTVLTGKLLLLENQVITAQTSTDDTQQQKPQESTHLSLNEVCFI